MNYTKIISRILAVNTNKPVLAIMNLFIKYTNLKKFENYTCTEFRELFPSFLNIVDFFFMFPVIFELAKKMVVLNIFLLA